MATVFFVKYRAIMREDYISIIDNACIRKAYIAKIDGRRGTGSVFMITIIIMTTIIINRCRVI